MIHCSEYKGFISVPRCAVANTVSEQRGSRKKKKPSIGGCYGEKEVLKNSFSCSLFLSLCIFYLLLVSFRCSYYPSDRKAIMAPCGEFKCQEVLQKTRARSVLPQCSPLESDVLLGKLHIVLVHLFMIVLFVVVFF